MSSVAVEDKIVMRPINTVKPYIRNPRKNSKTVDALVKIIPKVGFNVPIVIDEKGIIVKGHARFTAAIRLGMTEVPCIITHADEEAIKADRITDNKISEFSEWIGKDLIDEVNDIDFDLSDIGLPKISFEDIPTIEEVGDEIKYKELSEKQKQKIFEEFKQGQDNTPEPTDEIEAEFQDNLYYKCVCEKCGYVMFIAENELDEMGEGTE